ncbi:MAG: lycopene cyclase family protein [Pseudomonadota bacterium]
MAKTDTTALILGGGAAGLQLGAACAAAGISAQIIEPRTQYEADRTWSFWAAPDHDFADCEHARWSQWSVSHGDQVAMRQSSSLVYTSLDAGRVYDKLTHTIENSDHVRLHLGCHANGDPHWKAADRQWHVTTTNGPITGRYVFDSRPPAVAPGTYGQFFVGREIRTDKPVFQANTVQLMHFRTPATAGDRGDAINFLYVLPFAPDHGLVEVTRFTTMPSAAATAAMTANQMIQPMIKQMTSWLADELAALVLDAAITTIRDEAGFIPMAVTSPPPAANGYCPMGLRGQAARASTGYAFSRMGQMATAFADQMLAGRMAPTLDMDGPLTRWMDQVFLKVLQRHPEQAPGLFHRLFERAPVDRLEHFLEGSQRHGDRLSIMMALPKWPFIKAALMPKPRARTP